MSRKKINRRDVNWNQANCRGINTELFFIPNNEFESRMMERKILRKICARCPIRQECLEVAVAYDEKGYWGGLSEYERLSILKDNLDTPIINSLRNDLIEFGLDYDEILEIQNVEKKEIWGQYAN